MLSGNYSSKTRNKLIAKALKEIGLIERYGSVIKRIMDICKDYGVRQPIFEENFNGFRVVLFKEKSSIYENVTENRYDSILHQLSKNNTITVDQLAVKLNVTRRTIIRDIEKMKSKGLIKRIGSAKGGHWEIL